MWRTALSTIAAAVLAADVLEHLAGGLLLDGDGGGEPLDGVDVGLLHEPEELPRVGAQRLDVAALSLGEDGVERQR